MEQIIRRGTAHFPNFNRTPIPHFTISASGLLALADLGTIANRTKIAGGTSWLDALLLAPGLHYQQAADNVIEDQSSGPGGSASYSAIELVDGKTSTYNIANSATMGYLERVGKPGQRVVVDVGKMPVRSYGYYIPGYTGGGGGGGKNSGRNRRNRNSTGQRALIWQSDQPTGLGWLSNVLYLASPVLTITAFVFMVLIQEYWGIGILIALMVSRILNIWVIKQRMKPTPKIPAPPQSQSGSDLDMSDLPDLLTEYLVDLGHGRTVCLRGLASDLQAITGSAWMKAKTQLDGYMEAAAKLIVYLVAAFSGNMSQAGSIIFILLLVITAALLGLSNGNAKTFSMNGRLAAPTTEYLPPRRGEGSGASNGYGEGAGDGGGETPYPDSREQSLVFPSQSDDMTSSGYSATMDDFAEKGQIGRAIRNSYPFKDATSYG
ncbi:hypothetical protein F5Y16DRAFT_390117 [Xylariaceae sp. FL0255]|nr:hypothetical protein F5Y16DRAFT_390117 [Xylariaceae sp. FL0255]